MRRAERRRLMALTVECRATAQGLRDELLAADEPLPAIVAATLTRDVVDKFGRGDPQTTLEASVQGQPVTLVCNDIDGSTLTYPDRDGGSETLEIDAWADRWTMGTAISDLQRELERLCREGLQPNDWMRQAADAEAEERGERNSNAS